MTPPRPRAGIVLRCSFLCRYEADRCWISVATLNRFVWPGPDLRANPDRSPATVVHGLIPERLFDPVKTIAMTELSKRVP